MFKAVSVVLMLLGVVLFFVGQWMAFEVYANGKIKSLSQNMAKFAYSLYNGESLISIPKASENIFLMKTQDGKVIASNNAIGPLTVEGFTFGEYKQKGAYVYVYSKKVSLGDYFNLFFEKPLAIGTSVPGLLLFLVGLIIVLRYSTSTQTQHQDKVQDEGLINSLKALRASLAMGGLIPRESLEEAKRIVEDIIKKMEGKNEHTYRIF